MNTRLLLFNTESKFFGEKPKNEQKFEEAITAFLPQINNIIKLAVRNMREDIGRRHPSFLNHNSKPNRVNEQIKGLLTEEFGDKMKRLSYNRFGLMVGNYMLLFKKLGNNGLPSNIKTKNSILLSSQTKLNFPGEPEIVFLGYTVDKFFEEVLKIEALKFHNNQPIWRTNLLSLEVNNRLPSIEILVEESDINIVVKVKNKDITGKTGTTDI